MIAELDAMGQMVGSILSFARDDAKREPRTADRSACVGRGGLRGCRGSRRGNLPGRSRHNRSGPADGAQAGYLELVDNALKYDGGADVTLTADPERVVVAVDDQGPGIPRSQREKVFEPFYRGDGARNPDAGGVGLGLSVARSIAREHGGDVVLAGRKGGGLSARLELPA